MTFTGQKHDTLLHSLQVVLILLNFSEIAVETH